MCKIYKSHSSMQLNGEVLIDNQLSFKSPEVPNVQEEEIKEDKQEQKDEKVVTEFDIEFEVEKRLSVAKKNLEERYQSQIDQLEKIKNNIIAEGITESNKIKHDAETEYLIIKEQVKAQAYKEGFDKGKQEGLKKLDDQLESVKEFLERLNDNKEEMLVKYEGEIIDLVYNLVQKITMCEVQTNKQIVFDMVKQACKRFRNSDYVKISLAECDVDRDIITDEKVLKKISSTIKNIEIELLEDAASGTVIVDNYSEIVDASVPTQLEFLKEVLGSSKKNPQIE